MSLAILALVAALSAWDLPQGRSAAGGIPSADIPVPVPATGDYGRYLELGERNVAWNPGDACFEARVDMQNATNLPYAGDFYFNLDRRLSPLGAKRFPGLTFLGLDREGRRRSLDVDFPRVVIRDRDGRCPPVFGNCSRNFGSGESLRSLPRAMMTTEVRRLKTMQKLYLSNQLWFFPSLGDTAPIGTNGDVFASIAPYWITTAGRRWSDQPYLSATIEATRGLRPTVRAELLRRGHLAPTMFALLRKSLKGVVNEAAYLTAQAHPTAMPPNGLDVRRYKVLARALTVEEIPPLVEIDVRDEQPPEASEAAEPVYAGRFAQAYALHAADLPRKFTIRASGAREFAFVQTHGGGSEAKIELVGGDAARVTVDPSGLSATNRVDIAVMGRNPGTGWGAPSYISFSRLDL